MIEDTNSLDTPQMVYPFKLIITHQLTMYCIRPFLYDINISLQFSQCYFMKCIGYNASCIGAPSDLTS